MRADMLKGAGALPQTPAAMQANYRHNCQFETSMACTTGVKFPVASDWTNPDSPDARTSGAANARTDQTPLRRASLMTKSAGQNPGPDFMPSLTRRMTLAGAAVTGAATLVGSPIAAQPAAINYRHNIWSMTPSDPVIRAFGFSVAEMRRLDRVRPASAYAWSNIARVHRDWCPHGNWFFLPWHRMYLHGFERICQHITGDRAFRVPFWDWSNNPVIPPAFWGQGNPLSHPRRIGQNQQLPAPSTSMKAP